MTRKLCSECEKRLARDGERWCTVCIALYAEPQCHRSSEEDRAYNSRRTPAQLQHGRDLMAAWGKAHPGAATARSITRRAIKAGKLIPQPCPVCAEEGYVNHQVVAHHDDYSKPLVVTWLCRRHHRRFHLVMKEAAAAEAAG